MNEGNVLAYIALFSWPLVCIWVFAKRRRTSSVARTTAWMMMVPVMTLPSNLSYDPPLVPALDKHRLAFLSIAVALQLFHRKDLLKRAPKLSFPRLVTGLLLFGVWMTVQTNTDTLYFGRTTLQGLTTYDALSMGIGVMLDVYIPFAVGQRVFRTEQDVRELFSVLSTCALVYAPFMLFEKRFSPQLHYWLYGYTQSSFVQMMRGDGFRPMVFMNHGLSLAMWIFTCTSATLALHKVRTTSLPWLTTRQRFWVCIVLLALCTSMAPSIYTAIVCLLVWFGAQRIASGLLIVISALVICYPIARSEQAIPVEKITEFFEGISEERAQSLDFRFDNEDILLVRAMERPAYGWGGYGRPRVYNEWGDDVSVTDGHWIITLGGSGYVGFAGSYALLVLPLLRYVWNRKRIIASARPVALMLAVINGFFTFDLIPNARSDFLSLAYAGMLWTISEALTHKKNTVAYARSVAQKDKEASAAESAAPSVGPVGAPSGAPM